MPDASLADELERLWTRSKADNATSADRFALRSHLEAHLPEIIAALRPPASQPAEELAEDARVAINFYATVPVGEYPGRTYAEKLETAKRYLTALQPLLSGERERIVAWLRARAEAASGNEYLAADIALGAAAACIKRAEHMEQPK